MHPSVSDSKRKPYRLIVNAWVSRDNVLRDEILSRKREPLSSVCRSHVRRVYIQSTDKTAPLRETVREPDRVRTYASLRSSDVTYVIVRCTCIRRICETRVVLCSSRTCAKPPYLFAWMNRSRTRILTQRTVSVSIFQVCLRPPLFSRQIMSRDDESRGTDAISIKRYMEYLFRVLEYGRIWPTESFSLFKILLSMAATIFFISTNVILLFSEIVALTMNINMKLFANIIGVIGMHAVGLIKWCYCIRKNRKIVDIMIQLEKCHVLCRKLDSSEEGTRIV